MPVNFNKVDMPRKIPNAINEEKAMEYVNLVYSGMDKVDAYKEVFPDRYNNAVERANKARRNVRATLLHVISIYERGKYVSQLYALGAEQYYSRFVSKKTQLLDKLYEWAMDEDQKMSHRLVATKTFLSSVPEPDKVVHHKVEVDVQNEFQKRLQEKQKLLYNTANAEDVEDVVVIENVDGD